MAKGEKGGYRTGGKHDLKGDRGYNAGAESVEVGASGAGMGNQQFNQDGSKDGAGGIGSTGTASNSSEK